MHKDREEQKFAESCKAAHAYLVNAVASIDEIMGAGYAKQHPELIGAFMRTASTDFAAAIIDDSLSCLSGVYNLDENVGKVADAMGSAGQQIAESIQNVAAMIDLNVGK